MSPQRARMIDDMILAGLAEGTQKLYVQAVRRLAAHYHRSPDLLSEEEVRSYLLGNIRNPAHKTCLAVISACGPRISEATTLEVGAIDRANLMLRIIGKSLPLRRR